MNNFEQGSVIIINTGQAGTIVEKIGNEAWVLLRNMEIWIGPTHNIRFPQDQADLDACILDVDRFINR